MLYTRIASSILLSNCWQDAIVAIVNMNFDQSNSALFRQILGKLFRAEDHDHSNPGVCPGSLTSNNLAGQTYVIDELFKQKQR